MKKKNLSNLCCLQSDKTPNEKFKLPEKALQKKINKYKPTMYLKYLDHSVNFWHLSFCENCKDAA